MVQSTESRVSYDHKVARNEVPMREGCDWENAGRIWNARAEAGMGPTLTNAVEPSATASARTGESLGGASGPGFGV
jgi:hypothetical protein